MLQSISPMVVGLLVPTSLLINPGTELTASGLTQSGLTPSHNSSTELMPSRPMLIAHQLLTDGGTQGTIHLEPNDSPFAGQNSLTWFHFYSNGAAITLANCNCNVLVYDAQKQPIAKPELSEAAVEGRIERSITANITFPSAGTYQVVLTGQPKEAGEFEPFEFTVPVTVRP